MKTTQVAAALIWQGDRFMICRRPANKGNALLWEFVGGKLEPGETHQQALIRECREELGITVEVGDEFCDVYHQYPDIYVHLVVFNAKIARRHASAARTLRARMDNAAGDKKLCLLPGG